MKVSQTYETYADTTLKNQTSIALIAYDRYCKFNHL